MELSPAERKRLTKLLPAARAQAALDLQRENLAVVGELAELRHQSVRDMLAGGLGAVEAADELGVHARKYRLSGKGWPPP